ncbi:MAG: hypothetical protein AB7I04_15460 [Pseudomonadales bacterium]
MRPDKNKAGEGAEALLGCLTALERDLDRLALFLAAYGRSEHPERAEALRWLVPVLAERSAELRSSSRVFEWEQGSV